MLYQVNHYRISRRVTNFRRVSYSRRSATSRSSSGESQDRNLKFSSQPNRGPIAVTVVRNFLQRLDTFTVGNVSRMHMVGLVAVMPGILLPPIHGIIGRRSNVTTSEYQSDHLQ